MRNWFMKRRARFGDQRGFTLIELLIVVAIIGILAAIAIPLYNNVQQRARIAKAQADVRALASAVSMFSAHTGNVPGSLAALTTTVANAQGQSAGPFMASEPSLPSGWTGTGSTYTYTSDSASGTFEISATGDGTTAKAP